MKRVLVQKFGGTSVANVTRLQNVAERVARAANAGHAVVVVPSAQGDTTDKLVRQAREILPDLSRAKREYDALLATGEKISIALLAMALIEKGFDAISYTGNQAGILTDNLYTKARILDIDTRKLRYDLAQGRIVVVAGFQGVDRDGRTTTLGRGGSDISAAALACALDAQRCEIYTDVEGFFTADPRWVPSARKLQKLSYDEALELTHLGAGVTHPRAVELARQHNLEIVIRSSFNDEVGTVITHEVQMEAERQIRGVACRTDEVKISVLAVPDQPGIAARLFGALAQARIPVDMVIQNVSRQGINDISFTLSKDDFVEAKAIVGAVAEKLGASGVDYAEQIAKVSIVGGGIADFPEVAAQMFAALGEAQINIDMISSSEVKLSCVIAKHDAKKAVQALHERFKLGDAASNGETTAEKNRE